MRDATNHRIWQITIVTVHDQTEVEYTQAWTSPVDRDINWTDAVNMATVDLKRVHGPRDQHHLVKRVIIERISLVSDNPDRSSSRIPKVQCTRCGATDHSTAGHGY